MKGFRPTHGKSRTRTYLSWQCMKRRCGDASLPRYKDYGGRGIKYDPRWKDFANFLADMGEKPTRRHQLERLDNDKGYTKENCCWKTAKQQAKNKRPPRCKIQVEGKYIREWAEAWGVSYHNARRRLKRQGKLAI